MTTSGCRTNIFVIVLFAFLQQQKSQDAPKLKYKLSPATEPNTYSTKIPSVINANENNTTKNSWKILFLDDLTVNKSKSIYTPYV